MVLPSFCSMTAISKRIHYGKFVAEIKFLQDREKYSKFILQKDAQGLVDLLTFPEVEKKVLARVRAKSLAYGRDMNEEPSSSAAGDGSYKVGRAAPCAHRTTFVKAAGLCNRLIPMP